MKTLVFTFVTIGLISLSTFASQVGAYQVKSCALIVPRTVTEDVVAALVAKGYRPINAIGVLTHEMRKDFNGSIETRAAKEMHEAKDLNGLPYLETKEDILPGVRFSNLSIGIAGVKSMAKYTSRKTILPQQADANLSYSAEDLPNCVETPDDQK